MMNNDKNQDGVIDKEEFRELIKRLGLDVSDKDAEEIFERFDTDHNGVLTPDEFERKFAENKVSYKIRIINMNYDENTEGEKNRTEDGEEDKCSLVIKNLLPNTEYQYNILFLFIFYINIVIVYQFKYLIQSQIHYFQKE